MSMVRCKANLHYYDSKKHRQCPYCGGTVLEGSGTPERGDARKAGANVAGKAAERRPEDATRHVSAADDRTRLIAGKGAEAAPESPVVGWLVVVEGPGRGTDYRINAGQNRIGRASQMEIALDHGDSAISSDTHALVIYDYQNNRFFLKHGSGKNLTYLNGEAVLEPRALNAYDRILVGGTQLLFLPLCSERFDWGG
jgi:hypothetical protein